MDRFKAGSPAWNPYGADEPSQEPDGFHEPVEAARRAARFCM